jgi:hypothetical protein
VGPPSATLRFGCPPHANNPRPVIIAFGDDFVLGNGGICVGVQGTAPNRALVFTWDDAKLFLTSSRNTFSVILYETTNVVDLAYQTMNGDPTATGSFATIGLQSGDVTQGITYGCKAPVALSGTGVRFTP